MSVSNKHHTYTLGVLVSSGGTAHVYRAKDEQGKECVIKILHRLDAPYPDCLRREIDILTQFKHPHVVTLVDHGEDWIAMDDAGDDLLTYAMEGILTEDLLRPILCQLVSVLVDVYHHGLYYCDLKLENVLYDGAMVRLCDWGGILGGTDLYEPPEGFTQTVDTDAFQRENVWSLGIMIYAILFQRYPFGASSGTPKQICRRKLRQSPYSDEILDLMLSCLAWQSQRIPLLSVMAHPWMMNQHMTDVQRQEARVRFYD